jgi:hypothetical protein
VSANLPHLVGVIQGVFCLFFVICLGLRQDVRNGCRLRGLGLSEAQDYEWIVKFCIIFRRSDGSSDTQAGFAGEAFGEREWTNQNPELLPPNFGKFTAFRTPTDNTLPLLPLPPYFFPVKLSQIIPKITQLVY